MQQLKQDAEESRRHTYTTGTYKNMFNHWVKYLAFCIYFKLALFPAQTLVLTWFAQHLSKSLRAHASIISCLSSVKNLHRLLNVTTRGFTGFLLKLTLQGLHRTSTHIMKLPALLRCIYNQLDPGADPGFGQGGGPRC